MINLSTASWLYILIVCAVLRPGYGQGGSGVSQTKEELLVSYLAAVSQFPKDLFESIQNLSQVDSNETPNANDTSYIYELSQCFRTDFEGSMISGALQVAIEEINANEQLLPNYHLVYLFNNTCGNEKRSTEYFMDHWKQGAKVFIGPEMNCRTEATMAAAQNLPIISYKCKDETVSDKKKYPTFARTVPAETEITKALVSLLKHYDWHKFTIIYESHNRNTELHNAIRYAIEKENAKQDNVQLPKFVIQNVSVVDYPFSEVERTNVEQIIVDTKVNTRIYLTFGNVRLFRRILLVMGGLGLMDNGEYVLIYLDTDYNWHNVYHAMNNHFFRDTLIEVSQSWDVAHSLDRQVVNYSKTALAIIPTPVKLESQKFVDFWRKATDHLVNFGVQKHDTALSIKANRFACYLYDAVMLYALALNDLITEHPSTEDYDPVFDGRAIISRIIGRKYTSMQGFDMRINENGDAQGNYTLLSLQSVTPVHNHSDPDYYPLDVALTITADFVDDNHHARLPKLRFGRQINWPNNFVPVDEPECGFHNEKCTDDYNRKARVVAFCVIIGLVSVVFGSALVTYRNRKFERELSMVWKIDPKDIQKIVQANTSTNSLYVVGGSRTSLLHRDDVSTEKKWMGFRGVALHKGAMVAIKEMRYSKRPRELTRATKLEMKAMRQLHHDNINSFMGIIICPMSICVVREFCAKGCLMEILRNSDLKLDNLFIASFVEDLIKGMIYLHESEVRVHGNLKSTNCLITSRWALQVADFGLHEIREGQEWDSMDLLWESFLWTAPELLRECEFIHAVQGTQKGDVYAFGVILHEMMTRQGPYQLIEIPHSTAEEVVRRVADGTNYRPSTKELDCQNYIIDTMTMCWSENPEHRPDFRHSIRHKLKQMFAQIYKRNIMDHMMERYQQQLEVLVEERTSQLREEKRRTENLLQRMLPISVANQLLEGKDVEPESFPAVTIYFSDIVGFTTISGQSTPLQVVNFLNKLYTLFDSIIKQYEVYKVETIGDAYMVVSGVPSHKDEQFHAKEIGTMALHLLSAVQNFHIPHRPEEKLKLRIGIHTGPVVAGVVGKTMPRYCLFGDTVNTASRMETYGEAFKIHCSENFKVALGSTSEFILEDRGESEIKGKGTMRTCWLLGRIGYSFTSDDDSDISDDLAPDIFPRTSVRQRMNSSWTIRSSRFSLQRDCIASTNLLKKLVERAVAKTPILGGANTNHEEDDLLVESDRCRLISDTECDSRMSLTTPMPSTSRHASCSSSCSLTNDERLRFGCGGRPPICKLPSNLALADGTLRKRSTSLPDGSGEAAHVRALRYPTAPNSVQPSPAVVVRKNAVAYASRHHSTIDPTDEPTASVNDLSSDDRCGYYPIRKRSLSYNDFEPGAIVVGNGGTNCSGHTESPLLTPPNQRKKRKDRKSVLSLQYGKRNNAYQNEILAKKPLGHPSLREKSPVASQFNRLLRKIKMPNEPDNISANANVNANSSALTDHNSKQTKEELHQLLEVDADALEQYHAAMP